MGMDMAAPVAQTEPDYKAIDALHKAKVDTFLANIGKDANFWGVELPFTMDGDTKVFEITAKNVDWEVEPGKVIKDAYTYNGIVPGPIIRITEGDKMRVNVKNEMQLSTTVHWHGVLVPNKMDGVAYVTQPPITPGHNLHLRVHRQESRLAHVPLASRCRRAGDQGHDGRFHHRPEGQVEGSGVRQRIHHGAQRHRHRLDHQRQELPVHAAVDGEDWARSCAFAT